MIFIGRSGDTRKETLLIDYLRNLVGSSPVDNVTKAVGREEGHDNVTEPYMILDAALGGEPKEWQHR